MRRIAVLLIAALSPVACKTAPGGGPAPAPLKSAHFDVRHELVVNVPEGARSLRIWMALPQADPAQAVTGLAIESPYPTRVTRDDQGNEVLFVEATSPSAGSFTVAALFRLRREEVRRDVDPSRTRPLTKGDRDLLSRHLKPSSYVVIDDRIQKTSTQIVGGETNPIRAARKLYDWTLAHIEYWVKDPDNKKASPVGSTNYCLDTGTGNCTDFHSLWMSLAMAAGIPTRIIYGSFLKKELDGQDVDQSYHCWLEFYAPGPGWIPLDVAVADIFVGDFELSEKNSVLVSRTTAAGYVGRDLSLVDYYFGNLEERRVTWSQGRDLLLDPPPASGPVNALPKAHVELDGVVHPEKSGWNRKLTYRERAIEES
ncbi:MAG: transglutaminase-like domain-containing protein [Planctomycetaceae bacterium]